MGRSQLYKPLLAERNDGMVHHSKIDEREAWILPLRR